MSTATLVDTPATKASKRWSCETLVDGIAHVVKQSELSDDESQLQKELEVQPKFAIQL